MTDQNTHCIVCGKAIPKRTTYMTFRAPQKGQEEIPGKWYPMQHAIPAKPHGHVDRSPGSITVYLDPLPRTRDEVQRYTNDRIVRAPVDNDGFIHQATLWDGERYRDRFFCKEACAIKQGYAAAREGLRWKWSKPK